MNAFLRLSKEAALSKNSKVTIVVGNQSCDLDSMTSAILYAWFRSDDPPSDAFSRIYTPLLNIPRKDIKLRPDFAAVFEKCHINPEYLFTLSELPSVHELRPENTRWILVDHNKLEGDFAKLYSDRVGGCIDHHDEENAVPKNTAPEPRVVEKCGSCTSLVLRELAPRLSESADSIDESLYTSDVLKLGLASILIDTHNLEDENKVKPVDKQIAGYLDKHLRSRDKDLSGTDAAWDKDTFFKQINDAKQNLDGLSVQDILRKDYKQWNESGIRLGISSTVKDLDFLYNLSRSESQKGAAQQYWAETAQKFMNERELDIWAIMPAFSTKSKDGTESFARQLQIHWRDNNAKDIVDRFEDKYKDELRLAVIENSKEKGETWKSWHSGNVAASRKQIAPMLRNTIRQCAKI